MRRTETLKLGDNSVTLRELTVGEVRGMLLSRPEIGRASCRERV